MSFVKDLCNVPEGQPVPWWAILLCGLASCALIVNLDALLYRIFIHKRQAVKEQDMERLDVIFTEKVMSLAKYAAFYTTGRLMTGALRKSDWMEDHAWLTTLLFVAVSVFITLLVEGGTSLYPLPEDAGIRVFVLKMQDELQSLFSRTSSSTAGYLLADALLWSDKQAEREQAERYLYILLSQFIALALEQWRVHRLAQAVAEASLRQDQLLERLGMSGDPSEKEKLQKPIKGKQTSKFIKGGTSSDGEAAALLKTSP